AFPSCAIQADDRIVLTFRGITAQGTDDVYLARFQPDGSLDSTFGGAGIVKTPLPGDEIPGSVAVQANGKIVVAGWQDTNFFAARYDPLNGSLDTTFGVNGVTVSTGVSIVSVSTSNNVDVAIQPDGKIVMAGKRTGGDFALVRFLGDSPPSPLATAAIGATVRDPAPSIVVAPAPSPDPFLIA